MCLALSVSWLVKPDSLVMSMLLFGESMLWSIIGESGFVVSSVVPSAQALFAHADRKVGLAPSKVCAGPCSMAPPVKATVNALGHCGGFMPPDLDAIWTLQGGRSPISERSSPIPERAGYSILSARHRQGTASTHARAPLDIEEQYDPIPTVAPEQSGFCGPVS